MSIQVEPKKQAVVIMPIEFKYQELVSDGHGLTQPTNVSSM